MSKVMRIGDALQYVMEERNLKDQYELGRYFGISQATVSNYLSGKTTLPKPSVAARIYGEFDIQVYPYVQAYLAEVWEQIKNETVQTPA